MISEPDTDLPMSEGEEKEREDGGKTIAFAAALELILGLQTNGEPNKKSRTHENDKMTSLPNCSCDRRIDHWSYL